MSFERDLSIRYHFDERRGFTLECLTCGYTWRPRVPVIRDPGRPWAFLCCPHGCHQSVELLPAGADPAHLTEAEQAEVDLHLKLIATIADLMDKRNIAQA